MFLNKKDPMMEFGLIFFSFIAGMTPNTDKLCFSMSYKVFTELSKNSIINASPNPAAKPNKIPIKILRLLSFKFLSW